MISHRLIVSAFVAAVATLASALVPLPVTASAPGLQVAPLQYEDTLSTTVKNGFIDVANPTDTTITVDATVRGFSQTDTAGNLRFFDDPDLAAAIKLDLSSFELGPREAVRVLFSVNPGKLPRGGVYAAVFFQTRPEEGSSDSSYVAQSANVGTLLILKNGSGLTPQGRIDAAKVPFLQLGAGLHGRITIANTAPEHGGVAYRPNLRAQIFPWGHAAKLPSGLILPGATRQFAFERTGSYIGLLPLTISDSATKSSRTIWILACTGWWTWIVVVLALTILVLLVLRLAKGPLRLRHQLASVHRRLRTRRQSSAGLKSLSTPSIEPLPKSSSNPDVVTSPDPASDSQNTESKIDEPTKPITSEPEPNPGPELASAPKTNPQPKPEPSANSKKHPHSGTSIH